MGSATTRFAHSGAKVGSLPGAARGAQDCLSLTFRTGRAGPPQGSYTLKRARFASTPLFVVPSDSGRRTYQAIINRAH